jgi:hypothetical protein
LRKLLSLLGLVSVLACGSSAPTIDPGMAGTWVGTSTASIAGQAPTTFGGQQVVVSVDGGTAQVAGVCPSGAGSSGSGTVTATGDDDSAAWTASVSCPAVSIGSNPPATITYTGGTTSCAMAMNSMNMDVVTLTNVSRGTVPATGGGTSQVVVTFTGTKQ